MRPDVGTIVGDEHRDVADDCDTELGGVCTQRAPLLEEQALAELMEGDAVREALTGSMQRLRLAAAQLGRPFGPARLEIVDKGRIESEVVEPVGVCVAELFDSWTESLPAASERRLEGAPLQRHQRAEVDAVRREPAEVGDVVLGQ